MISSSANSFLNSTSDENQLQFQFSHSHVKEEFESQTINELEQSEDNKETEEGVTKFIEWIRNNKLEIRAFPSQNIHAKLYNMTFAEGVRVP